MNKEEVKKTERAANNHIVALEAEKEKLCRIGHEVSLELIEVKNENMKLKEIIDKANPANPSDNWNRVESIYGYKCCQIKINKIIDRYKKEHQGGLNIHMLIMLIKELEEI